MAIAPAKITYRPAQWADHDGIAALFYQLDRLHSEAAPALCGPAPAAPLTWGDLERQLQAPDRPLWVAQPQAEAGHPPHPIVGVLSLRKILPAANSRSVFVRPLRVHIDTIMVDPAYRRQGIGQAFMEIAEEWAREIGATRITLNVFDFNRGAQELYRAAGFSTSMIEMYRDLPQTESNP